MRRSWHDAILITGLAIGGLGLLAGLDTMLGFGCGLCAGFGLASMQGHRGGSCE